MTSIPLSSGVGELMAPGILLTALIVSPEKTIQVDAGVLHGRSQIESAVRFVPKRDQVPNGQAYPVVWVAVELDANNRPVRYKGLAVSELWIDRAQGLGYKSLAEQVNRMDEAMRGGIHVTRLDGAVKTAIAAQLRSLSAEAWEGSAPSVKEALAG